jgi:hypothetical protein
MLGRYAVTFSDERLYERLYERLDRGQSKSRAEAWKAAVGPCWFDILFAVPYGWHAVRPTALNECGGRDAIRTFES